MKLKLFVAVLAVLCPLVAHAQESFPAFSEPPSGVADFTPDILNPPEGYQGVFNLHDVAKPVEDEVVGAGLCETAEMACNVAVRVEVVRRYRCIDQADQERNCALRMYWKEMKTIRIAVRYLLMSRGRRSEGVVVDDATQDPRFFSLKGTGPSWRELSKTDQDESKRQILLVRVLLQPPLVHRPTSP